MAAKGNPSAWTHSTGTLSPRDRARRQAALRWLILPVSVFLASVLASTELMIGLFEIAIVGLILLVGMAIFGIGLLLSLVAKRWSKAKTNGACLFVLLASLPLGSHLQAYHARNSQEATCRRCAINQILEPGHDGTDFALSIRPWRCLGRTPV